MALATETPQPLTFIPAPAYILANCPTTGRLAKKNQARPFTIPDGKAVWWKCSACQGWHASIIDGDTLP